MSTNRHATRNVAHNLDITRSFWFRRRSRAHRGHRRRRRPWAAQEQRRKRAGFSITVAWKRPYYSCDAPFQMPQREPEQDVTALLYQWQQGDASALERLLPIVYDELRRVARARLRAERPGHTLQATALVH